MDIPFPSLGKCRDFPENFPQKQTLRKVGKKTVYFLGKEINFFLLSMSFANKEKSEIISLFSFLLHR